MSRLGEIIMVAGPNGAGKTSFAREFLPAQARAYVFVNADEIARSIAKTGIPPGQIDIRSGRLMLNRIEQAIALGNDLMIETTLASNNWKHHIPGWQQLGYAVILYYLRLPDADSAVARVKQRVLGGGHDIPETVIRRRFDRSMIMLNSVYKHIVDEWYVFSSMDDEPPSLVESWRS